MMCELTRSFGLVDILLTYVLDYIKILNGEMIKSYILFLNFNIRAHILKL